MQCYFQRIVNDFNVPIGGRGGYGVCTGVVAGASATAGSRNVGGQGEFSGNRRRAGAEACKLHLFDRNTLETILFVSFNNALIRLTEFL